MTCVLRSPFLAIAAAGILGMAPPLVVAQATTNATADVPDNFESNLPLVYLNVSNQVVANVNVPCTVKITGPKTSGHFNTLEMEAGVHIHGGISQGLPKKSYAVDLVDPAGLVDLPRNRAWLLNAAYIDRSLIRHKLAYDLFRSLSSAEAPRFAVQSRFVEVFLNGKYNGVYLLMDRIHADGMGLRAYDVNDTFHTCIYKAVNHDADFRKPGHSGYEQKEPDPATMAWWEPMDEFNRFVITSNDDAFFDRATGIRSRLNVDNAIDFHLLVLASSNFDGITKNFYFARNGQKAGPLNELFFFAPWDYDGSFGRTWNGALTSHTAWLSNGLFKRLMKDDGYRRQFAARWTRIREKEFSVSAVQNMVDQYVAALGPAPARNALRWPMDGPGYQDRTTFEEDTAYIKTWVETRFKWLDEKIGQYAKTGRED